MAKMLPPDGHTGSSGLGPQAKDGSYDVPSHKVAEMRAVHGFRMIDDPEPLRDDASQDDRDRRLLEAANNQDEMAQLRAQIQALQGEVTQLTRANRDLAAQVRRTVSPKK